MSQKNIFKKIRNWITLSAKRREDFPYSHSLETNFYNNNKVFKSLNKLQMMELGIISQAIKMISSDVAKAKFRHYKINPITNDKTEIKSNLSDVLNLRPIEKITGYELKKILVWNLILFGRAYLLKDYDDNNKLKNLIPILPSAVNLKKDQESGRKYYGIKYSDTEKEEQIDIDEIIEINYETIQGIEDIHFSSLHRSTLAKLHISELTLVNAIAHDTSGTIMIKVDNVLNPEQTEQAQKSIEKFFKNFKNEGMGGLVVGQDWEVTPGLNMTGSKIDSKQRDKAAAEIAAIFGIPPQKLGIETTNTYNSLGELNKSYIDNAIVPLLTNITMKITNELLPIDECIDFSMRDLLSSDPIVMKDIAASFINNGILSPNEIREMMGYEKTSAGDMLLANGTLKPLINEKEKSRQELEKGELEIEKQKIELEILKSQRKEQNE